MPNTKEDFHWGKLVVSCLRSQRETQVEAPAFVDFEVLPHFDGRPDDMFVWFFCALRTEVAPFRARLVRVTQDLREVLLKRDFPAQAAATLKIDVTSMEDIEAGGGRFAYFR
jgi:hypothetical protein